MKQPTPDLNLDEELTAIADFLRLTWTQIDNLESVLARIRAAALRAGRLWIDDTMMGNHARGLVKRRKNCLEAQGVSDLASHSFDALTHYLEAWWLKATFLRQTAVDLDGQWNYSASVTALLAELRGEFPLIEKAQPLGYADSVKAYRAGVHGDTDAGPDYEQFTGTKVEGVLSGDFVERTYLPSVTFWTVTQAYTPDEILVGAVFSHFLLLKGYLNSVEICKAIDILVPSIDGPIVFELDVSTDCPLLNALNSTIDAPAGEQAYRQYLADKSYYDSLTAEQKAAKDAEDDAEMADLIEEVRNSQDPDPKKLLLEQQLRACQG